MTESVEKQLAALHEMLGRQEDLDPELADYVGEGPLGPTLRHPLVYEIMLPQQMYAMANERLKAKREIVRKALTSRQWNTYVFAHERPWRIDAFANIAWRVGDRSYWKLLGSIYTDTENLWQNYDMWVDCLTAERRYRSHLMSPEERKLRRSLDPVVEVYRGWSTGGTGTVGLSWTTSWKTARFFSQRLAGNGDRYYIATGKVRRPDVLAYFDGRNEHEVVVLPGKVYGVTTVEVGA